MKRPAWAELILKIMNWRPDGKDGRTNPIIPNIAFKEEPEGGFSEARGERKRIGKLKLRKETLRTLSVQARANKNLDIMHQQNDPLRNEKQGLILADSYASCVGLSACPNCPDNVDQAMREPSDFCPGVKPVTQGEACSLLGLCQQNPFSGDPYGDLCVTGRAGGTGGDLGGC